MDPIRIHRKEAVSMDELVKQYIRSMKLAAGLNTQRIFAAWDACSGAGSSLSGAFSVTGNSTSPSVHRWYGTNSISRRRTLWKR